MRALVPVLLSVVWVAHGRRLVTHEPAAHDEGIDDSQNVAKIGTRSLAETKHSHGRQLAALFLALNSNGAFSALPSGIGVYQRSLSKNSVALYQYGDREPLVIMSEGDGSPPTKKKKVKVKAPKAKVKGPGLKALEPERVFFEGPPSNTELIIPGLSVLTVVGVIPFAAAIARRAFTNYRVTSRRLEVISGAGGTDLVQVLWREITKITWIRRFGGSAGDMVFSLKDGSNLEMRGVPDFERNLAFIMESVNEGVDEASGYPDTLAGEFWDKVDSGEEEKPELPPLEE